MSIQFQKAKLYEHFLQLHFMWFRCEGSASYPMLVLCAIMCAIHVSHSTRLVYILTVLHSSFWGNSFRCWLFRGREHEKEKSSRLGTNPLLTLKLLDIHNMHAQFKNRRNSSTRARSHAERVGEEEVSHVSTVEIILNYMSGCIVIEV